jgi:hypothetical protein
MEAVHRHDHREVASAPVVRGRLDQRSGGGLACARRSCDPQKEPAGRAVDRLEQRLDRCQVHRYSALDAAHKLIRLSVA